MNNKSWDIFISYAREDRHPFVQNLVCGFRRQGLSIWYDEFRILPGDSVRAAIDQGISKSEYGIVVLSRNYFAKKKIWTARELDGLFTQERPDRKMILPIWLDLSFDEVSKYSPTVAAKAAIHSSEGIEKIVHQLKKVVKPRVFLRVKYCETPTSVKIFPKLGVVFVEDVKARSMKPYDFCGRPADLGGEFTEIQPGDFEGKEVKFQKGDAILQINEKVCKDSDWGKNIILNFGTNENPEPFVPVFFSEGYTLGIFGKDEAKVLAQAMVAMKGKIPVTWRRMEIEGNSFRVFGSIMGDE